MSAKHWKLVITPLSAVSAQQAREVVVEGDNWLSALRAARKALGQEGAVPPGASCVMSATGEVTILDSAERLRYLLARAEPPAAPAAEVSGPNPLPPLAAIHATLPKRPATVAYSSEESAAMRAALAPTSPAPPAEPSDGVGAPEEAAASSPAPEPTAQARASFAPARPSSGPPAHKSELPKLDPRRPIPAKRTATVGYAPDETTPEAAPKTLPAPEAAPRPLPALEAALPAPNPAVAPGARQRKQTVGYSPAEPAAARAQPEAPQATVTSTKSALASSAHDDLMRSEAPSMMVTLGHRDEEPSTESPLTYRERSYFWQPPADRTEVERALRAELVNLRKTLGTRPRGQYVNLAVFDHAFGDKPERSPVATLQWKDWRGEPVFAWLDEIALTHWTPPQLGEPVASSFFPAATTAPVPPAAPAAAPAPIVPHPTPSLRAQGLADKKSPRETTGEQDLRLAIAFEAVQDLYFLATPADGLDFAVKLLQELVPAEAISGCIYDINTDEFRFVALTGSGANERRAAAVRSTSGLFAVAARSGQDSLIFPDITSEPRFEPEVDGRTGLTVNNMAFFVLHKADQLFGMLQLINRENVHGFRDADIAVASYVANQVTAFLREKRGILR